MACLSASRLMALLAGGGARPDLALLRLGLQRSWIALPAVKELLLAGEVHDSTDEVMVEVLLAMDEGRDAVQAVLDAAVAAGDQERDGLLERAWWGLLISNTLTAHEDTTTALTSVAALWADMGYPPAWESFINYLPQPDSMRKGPDGVVERAARCSKAWVGMLGGK